MGSFDYHWKTLRVYEIRKKNDLAILFDGENLKVYEPEDNNAVAYLLEDLGDGGAFRHNFYYGGSPALQIDSEIKVGKVLRPLSDNAIDLGNENYKFRHGYFGGNIKVNDILPVNDYIVIGGGQQNFVFPSIYGNPIAYKEPYKVEQYDPSTGNWNDITGNYTWKYITDMKTGTYVNSGVKSSDGSETDWRIRLYYDLGGTWRYIHGILLTLQHTHYVKEVVIEASNVSDFSSNVVTLLNLSNIKVYVWDGAFFARTSTPYIGSRRYVRITLRLSTTSTTLTIKIWEIMLLNLAPPGVFFDTLLPFDWDSDRNIKLYGNLTPNDNNKYDIGDASYKFRNLYIAGFGDLGSLRINGTEVIDSSRNLKNVSASRSIITDFFASPFWDNIPDKPSQFPPEPHTHSSGDITFNTDVTPASNNAYDLGKDTLRWRNGYINNIYANNVYASSLVRVGDIELANGWKITEDDKYGIVLLSPNGKKYRFKLEEVKE